MKEDASGTLSGRDSPGLSGIKWDSAGFQGSSGADVTARPGGRGLPSTASRMAATASGERPFLTGAWPVGRPRAGRVLVRRLRCRALPLEAELVGAFDALENQRQAGELCRRHGLLAPAEIGQGGERQRPQGLDQDEPRPALGSLAERTAPTPRSRGRSPAARRIRSRRFLV